MSIEKDKLTQDLLALFKESKSTPMTEDDYTNKLATAIDDYVTALFLGYDKHIHIDSTGKNTTGAIHG